MEYWTYFFWAYCFIGASKTALVLTTFPAATRAAHAMHEEAGISGKAIAEMQRVVLEEQCLLPTVVSTGRDT